MSLTPYHAKLFAHELTKRSASDSIEKLASALSDAQVTLNPHQIEAALFAFRSPLSKGAILADEVGLGKTIEAGILLAQRWAERRRRLLVICPANLRKQWSQELADKFFLPTAILEAKTFQEAVRSGNLNPFQQSRIIICSYQFARAKEPYLAQTEWDLIVIDEAHRLRNVYKPGNKIGKAIKGALADRHKLLLTATPLQNSLQELYGLVSIIDEFTFGDLRSFNAQFGHAKGTSAEYNRLKDRLSPLCQRTLRRQVLQYVSYTKRHALVQEFVPSAEEQRLYDLVSEYLQQPTLYALPSSQRQLMTLMLRKLLASSTHAISGTLAGLAAKLEAAEQASVSPIVPAEFAENFEILPELEEEWTDGDGDDDGEPKTPVLLTPEQREERRREIVKLREFHALASSIQRNSKGERLLTALKNGFEKARAVNLQQAGSLQQKALIFTESRRTQDYLFDLLQTTEFAGKVVLFNGSNTDELSQRIYRDWAARHKGTDRISGSLTADKRAALVDFFRDEASIMIATEAAAEGINLQFCNLVVNYDLPWNPQRIEQRIGRCHRYGQKFDVVVVNFLNKANAADIRVYQLLAEKFQLFEGVFGASDEVLGAIESGIDFEKRIVDIYQRCRTPEQISLQFDQLQQELQSEIGQAKTNAHEQLLNNFDQEVIERVRVETSTALSRFQDLLWKLARFYLAPHADFDPAGHAFALTRNPFSGDDISLGRYEMRKNSDEAHTFRVGHPLAQGILAACCDMETPQTSIRFRLKPNQRIAALEEIRGSGGWVRCALLSMESGEPQDRLIFAGTKSSGALDTNQCRRLFDLEEAIRAAFPMVAGFTDFERSFPSLCFALATGVGKTRLMGAFCTYLYQARGIRNFFILAPNLTIYNKLTQDFTPGTPKYVFQGIADFVAMPPRIETGDTYQQRGGLFHDEGVEINIFNISKINADTRGRAGATPNFKKMNEYLGQPYFDYLRSKDDLVILMDESHRYRGDAGVRAIEELQPVLGLELTATPQTQQGARAIAFKNVIYSYPLASALADGFVKKPAVATRENFRAENYSPEELEDVKLADGIALHENTRVELEAYAAENRVRLVKPFMLVVARQTEHANELVRKLESDAFAAGRYRGRVITIHSNLSGVEREENVQKLLEVESADNPVEIVVHVDQLKEGWDVTNLYTIVPLRTADSRTLVEQSIGRGLRLPYGHRTGNPAVDRLTIVAHDRFQEIVDLANSGDSPLKVGFETVYVPTTKPTLVPLSPGYLEELGLATPPSTAPLPFGQVPQPSNARPAIFTTEPERQAAQTTLEVIREFEKTTKLADLSRPEVQASIVEQVKQRLLPVQGVLPGTEPLSPEQTTRVVARLTESLQQRMIAIPRITVTPRDGSASGFKDFNLDCSSIRQSYAAQDILTIDLTDNSASRLGASRMRSLELQLENYIVRNLMDYDDIDYMANAELLYKLSGQLIAHLRSYLSDEDQVLSVLYANQKPFAAIVRGQMQQHFEQPETGFEVKVTRSFQMLSESFASADAGQHAVDFRATLADPQAIRSMVFGGFARCCYSSQRFDSDTERRFAMIADRESLRWLKPSARDLHIYYSHEEKYHPDFVVETARAKYICETKALNEMEEPTVLLKAKAAQAWCQHASLSDDKPWRYVLIPHSAVQHSATLEGLIASFAHQKIVPAQT